MFIKFKISILNFKIKVLINSRLGKFGLLDEMLAMVDYWSGCEQGAPVLSEGGSAQCGSPTWKDGGTQCSPIASYRSKLETRSCLEESARALFCQKLYYQKHREFSSRERCCPSCVPHSDLIRQILFKNLYWSVLAFFSKVSKFNLNFGSTHTKI